MTLYELTQEWQELLDMMEDPEINPQAVTDTLEAIGGEIEEKADGYAKVIASLKADAEALKKEEDRLSARRKAITANIDRMKTSLEDAMRLTGKTKFKTELFSFGIQKNAPAVFIKDETKVPEMFWVVPEPVLDKKAAAEYLKAAGSTEWGEMRQSESLRIR